MPPEPNQQMDKLLKTYAKERREQAGGSSELHPATRRMLQGEVARVFGQPKGRSRPALAFLGFFRLRWTLAGALIAGVALWVCLRPATTHPAFQMAQAKKEVEAASLAEALPPAQSAAKQKYYATRRKVSDLSLSPKNENAPAKEFSMSENGAVYPPAPAVAPLESPLAKADVDAQKVPPPLSEPVPDAAAPPPPPAEVSTVAITASGRLVTANDSMDRVADKSRALAKDSESSLLQRFNRLHPSVTNSLSLAASSRSAVLHTFQVERNGNHVRIIDEDGSVYNGEIADASTKNKLLWQNNSPDALARKKAETSAPSSPVPAGVPFRVTGLSLTLKTNVVFDGVFESVAPAEAKTKPNRGPIHGQLQIGSDRFNIDAKAAN